MLKIEKSEIDSFIFRDIVKVSEIFCKSEI